MKEKINLSINPIYQCNLRCNFCYLSKEQLSSRQLINTQDLFDRLSEVSLYRHIDHVDLYGGEIAILKDSQIEELIEVIRIFYKAKINVISNLTRIPEIFLSDHIDLSISWDYFARENWQSVYKNMHSLDRQFRILILASKELIEMNDSQLGTFIGLLNELSNLESVEIKPYSKNQSNQHDVSYSQFEEWIKRWMIRKDSFQFQFINIKKIQSSLEKEYISWSDEHLYITPSGKFSVLEFDNHYSEYFLEMENFSEYITWTNKEKSEVSSNPFCSNCKYLGHCLSEHLQPVIDLKQSCNGFKNLLDWYSDAGL